MLKKLIITFIFIYKCNYFKRKMECFICLSGKYPLIHADCQCNQMFVHITCYSKRLMHPVTCPKCNVEASLHFIKEYVSFEQLMAPSKEMHSQLLRGRYLLHCRK